MANEYEELAQGLLNTKEGSKVLGNIDKLTNIMQRPEGKKLLEILGSGGGEALKKAAKSAAKGDKDAAQRLITTLMSTPEGSQLISQVIKAMK